MSENQNFIDPTEIFPRLPNPPIAEAVIDFQVSQVTMPDMAKSKLLIQEKLGSQYHPVQEIHESQTQITPDPTSRQASSVTNNIGCIGFKAVSLDGRYIAILTRARLSISRIGFYESWSQSIEEEAKRIWSIYSEVFKPNRIIRLGIRYINKLQFNTADAYESCLQDAPNAQQINRWPLQHFFHRDIIRVPETPYALNLIQTIVPIAGDQSKAHVVIDVDVYLQQQIEFNWSGIEPHLKVMRYIKNKVFFTKLSKQKLIELQNDK